MLITPEKTSNETYVITVHATMMSDWLPKLGPQAFLAWLQFHSWKDEGEDPQQPFIIPLPLTQLIKRLKVGNSTFYDKILRPLWNYGLINLQYAKKGGHHIRLIVYAAPLNQPENADKPLELLRFYDEDLTLSSFLPKEEHIPGKPADPQPRSQAFQATTRNSSYSEAPHLDIVPIPTPNGHIPSSGTPSPSETAASLPAQENTQESLLIQENHPASLYPDHLRSKEDKRDRKDKEIDPQLPEEIRESIARNKDLQERLPHIVSVYHTWKEHPHFTPAGFLKKLESCIRYPHQRAAFGAYLHKALLNEWTNKPRTPEKSQLAKPIPNVPNDVPEWVRTQAERYSHPNQPQNNALAPEQQAEIDRLLKALEEV